jgi:hypothetical protein
MPSGPRKAIVDRIDRVIETDPKGHSMQIQATPRCAVTNPSTASGHTDERYQSLVILLDGITAGDYLTWVRDPEPPALGRELRSIAVDGDSLGEHINVDLVWDRRPPDPRRSAAAAGFVISPEVAAVLASDPQRRPANWRGHRRSR